MKPTIIERGGVHIERAIVYVQSAGHHGPLPTGCCSDAPRQPRAPGRSSELAAVFLDVVEVVLRTLGIAIAQLLPALLGVVSTVFVQAVYLVGLGFALSFWMLGRTGDALRALEAGMGGSPRRLTQPLLPPWMRQETALDELPPPAPEPRTFKSGHRLQLTAGEDHDDYSDDD